MTDADDEALLDSLRRAKGTSAEHKLRLVNLRAEAPDAIIFVFEGDDDRGVYFSWVRYLDATFTYEPLTCNGKSGVLKLKEAVDRDAGNLAEGVYFFIDRDFDDARGHGASDALYMTDAYSIENYLVTSDVLDQVLSIEFHCDGIPGVRAAVIESFMQLYDEFLRVTRDINFELFVARRLAIDLEQSLGSNIGKFVRIDLSSVVRLEISAFDVIRPRRPVTEDEKAALSAEFDALEPRSRYRGKFALAFLLRWLEILVRDRVLGRDSIHFADIPCEKRVRAGHFSSITLAPRARPPSSFAEFFSRIPKAA